MENEFDKKDYVISQLRRTNNKKYENYVITRIWHLLNDLDIKIITQQYVKRDKDKFGLADLFFPQFNIIVEVDEQGHFEKTIDSHLKQVSADEARDKDFVKSIGIKPKRINANNEQTLEDINKQIDELVKEINEKKKQGFKKWDYEKEFDNQQYIDKGYMCVEDNVMFKKQIDAYNCFGHNYKGFQGGGTKHKYKNDVDIWCPKLYEYGEWNNEITLDEEIIYENNKNKEKNEGYIENWINYARPIRYVFAHSRDNLGRTLYRFKGAYKLNPKKTREENRAVWERISKRVETVKK